MEGQAAREGERGSSPREVRRQTGPEGVELQKAWKAIGPGVMAPKMAACRNPNRRHGSRRLSICLRP